VTTVIEAPAADEIDAPPVAQGRVNRATVYRCGGVILISAAIALLCFLAEVTVVGAFQEGRDQLVEYAQLRGELANGIAPVGGYDYEGNPLPSGAPVALLNIPAIGVDEVVAQGTSSEVLQSGPGHERDTPLPGQAGVSEIYGREATYGGPFQHIDELTPGETFTVTTGQGVSMYEVIDVRHAGSPEHSTVAGQGYLILATADGAAFMPGDVTWVDAELKTAVQPNPGGAVVPPMNAIESPLAGDTGAGTAIFFWSELLIAAVIGTALLSRRWGTLQTWLVAAPVLLYFGLSLADQIARTLPNLL